MKQNNKYFPFVLYTAILSLPLLLLPSCSMMQDDRSDCPECRTTLRVKLRYDYNTQRANMFGDHVEEATVYVVDPQTGIVIDKQSTGSTTEVHPMNSPSFAFNFEGLTPGFYRLYATGRSAADAAFKATTPQIGEKMNLLQFSVPTTTVRSASPLGSSMNGQWSTVNEQRLDTLWNTLMPVDVAVPEDETTEATIPLMRLTNDLNVVIFRRDGSLDNSHEHYEVTVTDENLTLGYDNEPATTASLVYQPFAAWTTETVTDPTPDPSPTREGSGCAGTTRAASPSSEGSGEAPIAERNAHYDLSLFRLLLHPDDAHRNARLIIRNRETDHEIVNIDLCHYLALARNAYENQHYSIQEYLDREYDYRLDFGFEGTGSDETWKYMTIHINVLSWALRIQNETL